MGSDPGVPQAWETWTNLRRRRMETRKNNRAENECPSEAPPHPQPPATRPLCSEGQYLSVPPHSLRGGWGDTLGRGWGEALENSLLVRPRLGQTVGRGWAGPSEPGTNWELGRPWSLSGQSSFPSHSDTEMPEMSQPHQQTTRRAKGGSGQGFRLSFWRWA